MNAVSKALVDIKYNIPSEIIDISFRERANRINQVISNDERIRSTVIQGRVIPDCSNSVGMTVNVPLDKCKVTYLSDTDVVVEIPKTITNNRTIVSCLSIVSNAGVLNTYTDSTISPLASVADIMYNNLSTINVIQSSRLEVVGENIILISDPSIKIMNGFLRCIVNYDNAMSDLNPRAYQVFSKACILCTKSYIWSQMRVKLDQGYVYGGHELGVITDIIDGYADAEEMYQEHLTTVMKKALFSVQSENMDRYIKSMLGNIM